MTQPRRKHLTIEARAEVARRFRAGESATALAKAFSITGRQVYRIAGEEKGETAAAVEPSKIVSVRLPEGEIASFMKAAEGAGLRSRSQALRSLVRIAAGFFEVLPKQIADFNQSVWLIGKQGQLLNQLARNTHRGKLRLTDSDRQLLQETIDSNRALYRELRAILDDAKARRGYATTALKRAATDG